MLALVASRTRVRVHCMVTRRLQGDLSTRCHFCQQTQYSPANSGHLRHVTPGPIHRQQLAYRLGPLPSYCVTGLLSPHGVSSKTPPGQERSA